MKMCQNRLVVLCRYVKHLGLAKLLSFHCTLESMLLTLYILLVILKGEYLRINNTLDVQKKLAKDLKKVAHEKTGIPDGADIPDKLKEVNEVNIKFI